MKLMICSLSAAAALALAGCGDSSSKPAPTTNGVSGNPLDAPAEYLGALNKAQQSAVKTVDVSSIQHAIQMFNVDNSRNPTDLDELVREKYLPKLPAAPYGMKIVYDAAAGTVKVVKQ